MGSNNLPVNGENVSVGVIRSIDDISKFKNINKKAEAFLYSVFNELDTKTKNGILEKDEGTIYVFDDGAVSIMKDNKFYKGMTKENSVTRVIGDSYVTTFADGAESTMKDGKLFAGKTAVGLGFTAKDGVITFDEKAKINKKEVEEKQTAKQVKEAEKRPDKNKKINGVEIQKLEDIVKEYRDIMYQSSKSDKEFSKMPDRILNLYLKNQHIFKKVLNTPLKPGNFREIELEDCIMHFSPGMDPVSGKSYWDFYLENKNND